MVATRPPEACLPSLLPVLVSRARSQCRVLQNLLIQIFRSPPFYRPTLKHPVWLIEEQNATSRAQQEALGELRTALEEQTFIAKKQREALEEQTEVMKDMKRALEDHTISTARGSSDGQYDVASSFSAINMKGLDMKLDLDDDMSSTKPKARDPISPSPSLPPPPTHQMPESGDAGHNRTITPSSDVDGLPDNRNEKPGEQIGANIVNDTTAEEGIETAAGPPSNPIHHTLLRLSHTMETVKDILITHGEKYDTLLPLSKTMETVKETLIAHGKKFDILTRDAEKDDKPYDLKAIDDESTCTALFEIAMTKTKEEVDEWIKRMDVSLVFIALFSAVLTAFLVPAVQALSPSSSNSGGTTDTPPPLPDVSAQNVCVLFYLALILSILDAVLSVLGRQWMSKLTNRPEGSTYRERLLRHLERERLAKRWLRYLVEGLHVILLWSIGLFVTGLLYQLWNLGVSFEEHAPRLLATWGLGIILSLSILGTVMSATMHALLYEVSPFGGPFSKLLLKIIKALSKLFHIVTDPLTNLIGWLYECISWIPWHVIISVLVLLTMVPLWLSYYLIEEWRVNFDTKNKEKLVGAFMDLIAEASDPKLLERAVASFSYVEWFENGEGTADQLEKTWNRLTATDTSIRVRETLRARMTQFVKDQNEKSKEITQEQIEVLVRVCPLVDRFTAEVYYASCGADNTDLRGLSLLPFEECVARVLCSYNHKGKLGDRKRIFDLAERHCHNLLEEAKIDDVMRILSHVDRLDLITSYIQYPHAIYYTSVVEFIAKDCKHEILRRINEFVKTVDQSRLGPLSFSQVFLALASPPPTDIDLSPLIDYFSRHPHHRTWIETSDTIIRYLTSFDLSQFSDSTTVHRFLSRGLDNEVLSEDGYWPIFYDEPRARARDLLTELNSLSSPPAGAIASASIRSASPSHRAPHDRTPNPSSQPDSLLSPSIDSISAAPENLADDTVPFADPDSDMNIPMLTLNHPPLVIASTEPVSDASLAPDSQAAFDRSPALENAHKEE
ncbi:hypothetical protein SISSUDRAFT_786431 [Sistotremastrum suecicum HHB10207 ss-3]|uniref:DUF6535 domain-containing protein n=1 Tax=Sistotremastrum suecicum HHB10207 ss-3 TaxID=1314776 RepID=A0A166D074_9AGAM|nr:hypothetical protein SISSUDRAFT_786431 [Sistotremastrum suecicum HHB10207 ss-3]